MVVSRSTRLSVAASLCICFTFVVLGAPSVPTAVAQSSSSSTLSGIVNGDQLWAVQDNVQPLTGAGYDLRPVTTAAGVKIFSGHPVTNNFNGKTESFTPPAVVGSLGAMYNMSQIGSTTNSSSVNAALGTAIDEFGDPGSNPRIITGCPDAATHGEARIGGVNDANLVSGSPEIPFPNANLTSTDGDLIPTALTPSPQIPPLFGEEVIAFRQGSNSYAFVAAEQGYTFYDPLGSASCGGLAGCSPRSEGGVVKGYVQTNHTGAFVQFVTLINPDNACSGGSCPPRYNQGGACVSGQGTCESRAFFGRSIVKGDFNNDGNMDIAVGAPGKDTTPDEHKSEGAVYVYSNVASLSGLVNSAHQTLRAPVGFPQTSDNWIEEGAQFGSKLAYEPLSNTLAVSAPFQDSPYQVADSGATFFYQGGSSFFTNHGYPLTRGYVGGQSEIGDFRVVSTNPLQVDAMIQVPAAPNGNGLIHNRQVVPGLSSLPSNPDPAPISFISYPAYDTHKKFEKVHALPDMDGDGTNDFLIAQQVTQTTPPWDNNNILRAIKGRGQIATNFYGSSISYMPECITNNSNSPLIGASYTNGGVPVGPFLTTDPSSGVCTGNPPTQCSGLPTIQNGSPNQNPMRARVRFGWSCQNGQSCTDPLAYGGGVNNVLYFKVSYGNSIQPTTIDGCSVQSDSTYAHWVGAHDPNLTNTQVGYPAAGFTTTWYEAVIDIAYIPPQYLDTFWMGLAEARLYNPPHPQGQITDVRVAYSNHKRGHIGDQ